MDTPLKRDSKTTSESARLSALRAAGDIKSEIAGLAYSLLDLTSLAGDESEAALDDLLVLAAPDNAPHVAALCVYPQFIPYLAKYRPEGVLLATVAGNFPSGEEDLDSKIAEVEAARDLVDEIDYVADRRLIDDRDQYCRELEAVVAASGGKAVKLILESGSLSDEQISFACSAAVDIGIKGLKTSTGKIGPGADLGALMIMMEEAGPDTLVKASGGVRSFDDAAAILNLSAAIRGVESLTPSHLRIGASTLADDLLSYRD